MRTGRGEARRPPGARVAAACAALVLLSPAWARAHGATSGEEIAQPLVTSGILGFVGYWVVMLWPGARGGEGERTGEDGRPVPRPRPRPRRARRGTRARDRGRRAGAEGGDGRRER